MIHGRGAAARDIISLSNYLEVQDYALIAPEATNHTWYPLSFLAPPVQNEPWLSSAISLLSEIVSDIEEEGISKERIFLLGFSQGACLALEFATRNATAWGGIIAFTGGLTGDRIYKENYKGDFKQTPLFIGTSDPDPHVPVERVLASAEVIQSMNGAVSVEVYKNMGHTISQEEIRKANDLVFKPKPAE